MAEATLFEGEADTSEAAAERIWRWIGEKGLSSLQAAALLDELAAVEGRAVSFMWTRGFVRCHVPVGAAAAARRLLRIRSES